MLLLSSACTKSGIFGFSYCPASKETGSAEEAGKGQNQDSWLKLVKRIFPTMQHKAEQ